LAEFSQLVRGRLAAQQPATAHLDADVLAAFAEDRLSGRERTLALAHLSLCAGCRDVLSLASKQDGVDASASAPIYKARKFMGWRLALVTALAVLAVSATVLLRLEQPEATLTAARVRPPGQPDAALVASATEVNGSADRLQKRRSKQSQFRNGEAKTANGSLRAEHKEQATDSLSGLTRHSADGAPARTPNLTAQTRRTEPLMALAPPPAPPQPAPTFDQSTQPAAQQSQTVDVQATASSQQVQPASRPGAAGGVAGAVMSRSDANLATQTAPAAASEARTAKKNKSAIQQPALANVNTAKLPAMRWTISSDGKLERAIETGTQGPVWQPVDVGEAATFRVVNATGADVWAGGNSGRLFHSTDGGGHWMRVAPEDNGRKIEGDVISINVAGQGSQIVRLRTSAAQNWTSTDAGKTWKIEIR
jgi:hypothetical protein